MRAVHEWSVREARDALTAGSISAETYARALLDRCAREAHLNAFIRLEPEPILAQARRADAARSRGATGQLTGLPVAIKDNIAVAGLPTTAGTPELSRRASTEDAAVVSKLLGEGAIAFGKTNLHELGFGFTGENAHYGMALNPYAPEHIAGGSSSGSAAAVAARLVPASLGTDTSGSLRVPAALCGVVGFRPTAGRYPSRGVVPIAPTRDTVGLLTRDVEDARVLDAAIVGPHPPDGEDVTLRGLRLGVPREYFYEQLDGEVSDAMETALSRLSRLGVALVEANLPGVAGWAARCRPIIDHEISVAFAAYLEHLGVKETLSDLIARSPTPSIRRLVDAPFLRAGGGVSVSDYRRCLAEERGSIRAVCAQYFQEHGVCALVFPTTPAPACRVDHALETTASPGAKSLVPYGRNTTPASIAGLPALSLPLSLTAQGLPMGLELDGPSGSDRRLLALGVAIEREHDRLPPPGHA